MHLWLINRTAAGRAGSSRWDVFHAHVIAADTAREARDLANLRPAREGHIWDDARLTHVERLGEYTGRRTRAHIILSHFNAG